MVEITVYVEGGIPAGTSLETATVDMSSDLRESFYKLFISAFEDYNQAPFNIIVEMGGGELNAAELFLKSIQQGKNAVLLIDVYKSKTDQEKVAYIEQELDKLRQLPQYKHKSNTLNIQDHQEKIFFMVREMEAWFLSQIEAIEACADQQGWVRKTTTALTEDSGIKNKVIQTIDCPNRTLNTLIQRNYGRKLRPKARQKYGKLKHSAALLEHLNLTQLQQDFTDVARLVSYITNK